MEAGTHNSETELLRSVSRTCVWMYWAGVHTMCVPTLRWISTDFKFCTPYFEFSVLTFKNRGWTFKFWPPPPPAWGNSCFDFHVELPLNHKLQGNIYRVSQEECARLREGVPYVKVYRYNPKHLCPKLNGYGDNGQRSLKLWQLLHTCWLPNTY